MGGEKQIQDGRQDMEKEAGRREKEKKGWVKRREKNLLVKEQEWGHCHSVFHVDSVTKTEYDKNSSLKTSLFS